MGCSRKRTDPTIAIKEKGRTFRLDNPNRREVVEVKVDGCLMTGERERCDYLFEVPMPTNRVLFVELKGKNIDKAVGQILSTLDYTKQTYTGYTKEAYVVSSRVPSMGTDIQVLKIRLRKTHQLSLTIKNTELTVTIP